MILNIALGILLAPILLIALGFVLTCMALVVKAICHNAKAALAIVLLFMVLGILAGLKAGIL